MVVAFHVVLADCATVPAQTRSEEQAALLQLLPFADKDLHKLEGADRDTVERLGDMLVPERVKRKGLWLQGGSLRIRFLWKLEVPTKRFVIFDSPTDFMSPGHQVHYLYFFDEAGTMLGSSAFSSGWRMRTESANLIRRDQNYLLEIEANGLSSFAHASFLREEYVLLNDRAMLARLEGKDGLIRNVYGCTYVTVGPPIPERTAEEWLKILSSRNELEVLQALMWIAGVHHNVDDLKQEQEDVESLRKQYPGDVIDRTTLEHRPNAIAQANLFTQVRTHKDLMRKLEETVEIARQLDH